MFRSELGYVTGFLGLLRLFACLGFLVLLKNADRVFSVYFSRLGSCVHILFISKCSCS